MNIALCFCVRNCEKYLPSIFNNIKRLKARDVNVVSIFVYDNCRDKSEQLLRAYQEQNQDTVMVKNIVNKSKLRTVRIANARNACLDILDQLKDISFHIMIDADDRCSRPWNINLIMQYLNNFDGDDWDCISFNRKQYYDLWALMYGDFRHHCLGFNSVKENRAVKRIMGLDIEKRLRECKTNSMEVVSAFNGFAIYKTDRFRGLRYDGLYASVKELIPDKDRESTLEMYKRNHGLNLTIPKVAKEFPHECCEHIFYHISAFNQGRKIKISKFMLLL